MSTPTPLFSGEVQFRRYSDTSTQGQQIVLSVASRDELQPFIGLEGKRMMAVFVLIGDDEQPVPPPAAKPLKEGPRRKLGPICEWLVMRGKEPAFREWLTARKGFAEPLSEADVASVVRSWCCVESRKDIDGNEAAEALFEKHFRKPWLEHQRKAEARA